MGYQELSGCLFKKPLIQIQMLKIQTSCFFLVSKNERGWESLTLNPKIPAATVNQSRRFMIIALFIDYGIGDLKRSGE